MAPAWMQRRGLEWVYRLDREPGRLWRRYLQTNSIFLAKWLVASLRRRKIASWTIGKVEETFDARGR
jgi:UDP-N-acetyl-D-mannosaminuronic acid transferase (WecB/TagA/CpsF family)